MALSKPWCTTFDDITNHVYCSTENGRPIIRWNSWGAEQVNEAKASAQLERLRKRLGLHLGSPIENVVDLAIQKIDTIDSIRDDYSNLELYRGKVGGPSDAEMKEYSSFCSRKRQRKHEEDKKKRGIASPIKTKESNDLLSIMGFPKGPICDLPKIVKPPPQLSKNQVMVNEVQKLDEQDTKTFMEELAEAADAQKELLAEVDELLNIEVEGEMTIGELIDMFWDDFPEEIQLNPPVEWAGFMRQKKH